MFTKVLKAQLWVYLRPLQQTSTVYLQILRLKPVTEQGSRHIRIRSLKIELNSRVGHWQSIDFKHVLQNWFKQPHTNWGIDINAFDESGNDLAVTSLRPGEEGLVRILRPVLGVGERKQHSSRLCTPCFSQIQSLLRKSGGFIIRQWKAWITIQQLFYFFIMLEKRLQSKTSSKCWLDNCVAFPLPLQNQIIVLSSSFAAHIQNRC